MIANTTKQQTNKQTKNGKQKDIYLSVQTGRMAPVDSRDGESIIAEPPELRVKYKIGKQIGHGNFAVVKDCTEK